MSTKITALPPSTGLVLTDIFPVVDDPGGVPVTQKATFTQLATLFSSSFAAFGSGVTTFNTRTGAVTLTLADVSAVADARYVLKVGDTMTGLLTIDTAATSLRAITTDAGTTNTPLTVEFYHRTSGVPAAGFGHRMQWYGNTTTTADQIMARIDVQWNDATDATRASRIVLGTRSTGGVLASTLILQSAQTLIQAGVVGGPGLSFQTDTDTGIYQSAVGNLGITIDGVNKTFWSALGTTVVGALNLSYVAKTATYTATALDHTIDCTANTFTVNLPTAVGITGRVYVVKNSGVGTITVDPAGAELIDSLATQTIVSGGASMMQSTGTGWIVI